MTNALGIAVTIAAARLFRIILRICVVRYRARHPLPPGNPNVAMQGGHSLIHVAATTSSSESFFWHGVLRTVEDAHRFPGSVALPTQMPTRRRCLRRTGGLFFAAILSLLFYASAQISGIVMALLQTTSNALSNHPDCGTYFPNATSDPQLLRMTDPVEFQIQEDSGAWAKKCYGATGTPDGCNQFVYKDIPYTVHNTSCPWSGGMCYESGQDALHLTTGAVDARRIGVNTPTKLEFNRTTTCSPLNMNETFIPPYEKNGSEYKFHYYYGPSATFGNASWMSRRWKDVGDAPTYLVK